jgi:hypothetical protein
VGARIREAFLCTDESPETLTDSKADMGRRCMIAFPTMLPLYWLTRRQQRGRVAVSNRYPFAITVLYERLGSLPPRSRSKLRSSVTFQSTEDVNVIFINANRERVYRIVKNKRELMEEARDGT